MVKFKPLNIKSSKDNGTYVFGDFSLGLYYLDTPRLLGEQLSSLALIGGQNIWAEKGALVPQYGYKLLDRLPEGERPIITTKDSVSSASFFIVTVDGEGNSYTYLYTANQGLKKYKTSLGTIDEAVACHDGKNMVIYNNGAGYLFGSYYANGEANRELISESVAFRDWTDYYEFLVPLTDIDYYWNGKEIVVEDSSTEQHFTVISVVAGENSVSVKASAEESVSFIDQTVDISEQTILPVSFTYYDEYFQGALLSYIVTGSTPFTSGWLSASDGGSALTPVDGQLYKVVTDGEYYEHVYKWSDDDSTYYEQYPVTIVPSLMSSAQNRLFIVDQTGGIYYSAIGGVDMLAYTDPTNGVSHAFDQNDDAGYFKGFYKDSSKVLSIEDYMDGVLICKENGIYYMTLNAQSFQLNSTGGSGEAVLSIGDMQVNIKKISNIGQQYAGDHVIVRESVIAYDSNSGTIVNAASVNVFNTIVAGDVIIDSAALNAYNSGISATKRCLTFNGQENLFTLYYGEDLTNGVVLKLNATLFPRKLDIPMVTFIGFNQGVCGVGENGEIIQDFKNGTIIENLPAYADFEAIGVRDNRAIVSTILEVTELNGIDYTVTTQNTGTSVQTIHPNLNVGVNDLKLSPLFYSDKDYNIISDSFELTSRWTDKKAHVTRIAAPMSGREGVSISIEFPKNSTFCLAALRLPDFSLGEI